jgi:hypothetical protein
LKNSDDDVDINRASLTHTLMELGPSWEAANCAATQNLPAFYGTQGFINMFTKALHWSLS